MTIEQLFQQMLLKKLHSEAEHLAKLVGASVQELYKVKVSLIMLIMMLLSQCTSAGGS